MLSPFIDTIKLYPHSYSNNILKIDANKIIFNWKIWIEDWLKSNDVLFILRS